jgi:hypothetical protein
VSRKKEGGGGVKGNKSWRTKAEEEKSERGSETHRGVQKNPSAWCNTC